jgi:hypothetical protein
MTMDTYGHLFRTSDYQAGAPQGRSDREQR